LYYYLTAQPVITNSFVAFVARFFYKNDVPTLFFCTIVVLKNIDQIFREIVIKFPIALTAKEALERLTFKAIKKVCASNKCLCVDVGAHKGRTLNMMIQAAPAAMHIAYEPLPKAFNLLVRKYASAVKIFKIALSDEEGVAPFYHVKENSSYSGFKKIAYPRRFHLEKIEVNTNTLDNLLPADVHVGLIKIDVSGAEYKVLKGATETIKRNRPIIIFKFEQRGSDAYYISPEMMWDYFAKTYNYKLYSLKNFLKDGQPLSRKNFAQIHDDGSRFNYFVAAYSK
jgi:FkbM family methyltransferase